MPPLTQEQTTAIQNANQNATINAGSILTPPATPRLPTITPPEQPTTQPFDINQYIQPPQPQDNTQLEQQTNSVFEQLLGAQQQASTQGARLSAMEQQAGIPQLTTDLADIQNQINKKELDFRRQQEAIVNNPGISTAAQRSAELADVSRKQASELADLEVIRAARTNSLNAIQSIIDRKVQREFADESRRIENLKFIYDQRKGDLTKAQDRQYQQMITREERAFNLAKSKYEQVENAKGELIKNAQLNGANTATLQKIMAAKDLAGAYAAAGNFGLSIDDKIKQARMQSSGVNINPKVLATPQFKNAQAATALKSTLQKAIEAVNKYGNYEKLNAEGQGILNSLQVQLRSEISTALEQGVVQPGEAASFDKIAGQLNKSIFIRNKKTLGALNSLVDSMDKRVNQQKSALSSAFGVDSGQLDTALGIASSPTQITFDENGNVVIPGSVTDEVFWK